MTAPVLPTPLPSAILALTDKAGAPTQPFAQWLATLDSALRSFFGVASTVNTAGAPLVGPLTNAANDAAAQAAGVPIGGLYRNGSAVQIRVA